MIKVCVLAFSEPPSHWGFRQSRKGTSWHITITADRVPACLSALKDRGIAGKALWPSDDNKPTPSAGTAKGKPGRNRPRGKKARAQHDADRYVAKNIKHATAIQAAARIQAIKDNRVKLEASMRKRELTRQAAQQLAREQQARADSIAADYLLKHPQGTA